MRNGIIYHSMTSDKVSIIVTAFALFPFDASLLHPIQWFASEKSLFLLLRPVHIWQTRLWQRVRQQLTVTFHNCKKPRDIRFFLDKLSKHNINTRRIIAWQNSASSVPAHPAPSPGTKCRIAIPATTRVINLRWIAILRHITNTLRIKVHLIVSYVFSKVKSAYWILSFVKGVIAIDYIPIATKGKRDTKKDDVKLSNRKDRY